MNTSVLQLALREIRVALTLPKTRVLLLALVFLLAFSGPFGTMDLLPFLPRIIYWAVIVLLTYCSGVLVFFVMSSKQRPLWQEAVVNGFLNGMFVSIVLLTANWVALGVTPFDAEYLVNILVYSFGVSVVIFGVLGVLRHPVQEQTVPQTPALLKRLDLNKRGALVSMTVRDHYVEVTTSKGTSLILMRLSDAIAETIPIKGFQIHRSHWVAQGQIENVRRQGDRAIVTLKNGAELPASRSNLKALKEAGLLVR